MPVNQIGIVRIEALNAANLLLYRYTANAIILSDLVVFDNSYSYFKNKRIRYSVILTAPVSVDELEKGAAKLDCE